MAETISAVYMNLEGEAKKKAEPADLCVRCQHSVYLCAHHTRKPFFSTHLYLKILLLISDNIIHHKWRKTKTIMWV
jgi:hypothetical protein